MKVCLKDLLEDGVYLYLKDNYRYKFFQRFLNKFKTKKMATDTLNLKNTNSILLYQRGDESCSLKIINSIANILKEDYKIIENNIELIKTKHGKSIKNPKFPIKLNENLAKIMGNLIGDGCITFVGDSLRVYYTNNNKILKEAFKTAINECFGEVHIWENKKLLYIPKIVGLVLLKFKLETRSLSAKVPKLIKNSNLKIKSSFIRALFEDDGSVSPNPRAIILISGSLDLVQGVSSLLLDFGIKTKLRKPRKNIYWLDVTNRENIIRFRDKIGFTEGYYKQFLLNEIASNYKRFLSKPFVIKSKIINILKREKSLKTDEIAKILNFSKRNTYEHLKQLRSMGKINSIHNKLLKDKKGKIKKSYCYSWILNTTK